MDGWLQFRFTQGSPEKEQRFYGALNNTHIPIDGNYPTVSGKHVTAGMLQYPDDGHFAVFDNPAAQDALRAFFTTLNDPDGDGVPEVRVR